MTTPAKTTTYTQCEQCGFWHAPAEPHCANCGVSLAKEYETVYDKELVKKYENKYGYIGLAAFIVTFLVSVAGATFLISVSSTLVGLVILVFGGIGILFAAAAVAGATVEKIGRIKARRRVPKPQKVVAAGLRQDEKMIYQRLDEMKQKDINLRKLAQELTQDGNSQRNHLRFQTIRKGLAELPHQRDRYFEKLREIELIRWSNQLSPLLSHSPNLTEQQTTERLEMLGKIRTQGQQLAQTWKQTPLADEETRCADRLNQALKTCDQLRQDLLDLKTALAVGDISAFSKEEQRASQSALELLDTFNALPDVGGFTAGFKKLEDEYFRLQSEDDVRQMTK